MDTITDFIIRNAILIVPLCCVLGVAQLTMLIVLHILGLRQKYKAMHAIARQEQRMSSMNWRHR